MHTKQNYLQFFVGFVSFVLIDLSRGSCSSTQVIRSQMIPAPALLDT